MIVSIEILLENLEMGIFHELSWVENSVGDACIPFASQDIDIMTLLVQFEAKCIEMFIVAYHRQGIILIRLARC